MAASGARTALAEMSAKGEFLRTDAAWRNWVKKSDARFPPEANRYVLYVSYACPWANRCIAVRNLKGLQDVIALSVVHPTWQRTRPDSDDDTHTGWVFKNADDDPVTNQKGMGSFSCRDCVPDTFNGCKSIRELYDLAKDKDGKYSVPVLWDTKEKTIVSNESSEIIRMFTTEFNDFSSNPEMDLYPEALRTQIDDINAWVYPGINNGVYRCGFAKSQEAYEKAAAELGTAMKRANDVLSKQRYLCGNMLTEADIRLFMTLVRFDEVYIVYFKTNMTSVRENPALLNYVRDIYQTPGVKESVNMFHIKTHYFTSHPPLNTFAIVPVGSGVDLDAPHGRDKEFA